MRGCAHAVSPPACVPWHAPLHTPPAPIPLPRNNPTPGENICFGTCESGAGAGVPPDCQAGLQGGYATCDAATFRQYYDQRVAARCCTLCDGLDLGTAGCGLAAGG